ncbi:hypothetical protein FG386_003350 [Cryptosporidium ryanae]|uniref:uncharacterized protein n=1 Tax=Cryptosporidium ryanae TaxID=515981 RepID=UPI00351A5AD3|nr:hypothetical protein FG386_003350 [Cryptosporidium ryanae]
MKSNVFNLLFLILLIQCLLFVFKCSPINYDVFEPNVSVKRGVEIIEDNATQGKIHYSLPNEVFYSSENYNLLIPISLVYYGDYIKSDYEYISSKLKYKPKTIGICGHFVPKNKTPKYTIIATYGALDTYTCSETSIKFFRKFVNYSNYILGPELAENSQIIVIDWFRLVMAYQSMEHKFKREIDWIKMIVRYYTSTPKHKDVIVPAISTAALINKLARIGVIPSMSNTGLYGLCVGGLNAALSTLLLNSDLNIVTINGPPLFIPKKLDKLLRDKVRSGIGTKYFVIFGKTDRVFNHRRHGKSLAKFISKYANNVDYLKVQDNHAGVTSTHVFTCIGVIATSLIRKTYSIILFKKEKYAEIPKKFSPNAWKRYVMYDPKAKQKLNV